MRKISININGYIEGFYGKLLKWSERHLILKKLNTCMFNTYFYCPKEDINHRLNWRQDYTNKWISAFKNFCNAGKKYNLNIFIGISPGLDFNFEKSTSDFKLLVKKAKILKLAGASKIVLMFDDIPTNFDKKQNNTKREGVLHAELANKLSERLNEDIFVVPRVYCDEFIDNECTYLNDFNNLLKSDISIFYCGKKIVSDTNNKNELTSIRKTTSNQIIFWDNLYANDYCPKKIFLGPYFGRNDLVNIMVNLTGMIETDIFLLDLVNLTNNSDDVYKNWLEILKKNKIPKEFLVISEYLYPINHNINLKLEKKNYYKQIDALDFLLWKWKTSLSREWYQFLLILKQDLQLFNNDLNKNRIKKIFPLPLCDALTKKN